MSSLGSASTSRTSSPSNLISPSSWFSDSATAAVGTGFVLSFMNFFPIRRNTSSSQFFRRHGSSGAYNAGHLIDNNAKTKPKMTFMNQNVRNKTYEIEH
jgi:hypothetical protein